MICLPIVKNTSVTRLDSGNVFSWHNSSGLRIGCILLWLSTVYRSTLSTERRTNMQWISALKSLALYRYPASSVCLSATHTQPCDKCDLNSIFWLLITRGGSTTGNLPDNNITFIIKCNEIILHVKESAADPGFHQLLSMVQVVAPARRTDPIGLLCNRKELFSMRVSRLLGCSSPKSMWFLWNIFSKGSHMLQCLCGKSLKKNKNPSGKTLVCCFASFDCTIVQC